MWFLYSFIGSFGLAATPLVARHFNACPVSMPLVMRTIVALLCLPALFISLPQGGALFYVLAVLSGMFIGVADVFFFRAVARNGAGVCSRLMGPMIVVSTFFLWLILDYKLALAYIESPLIGGGILLSIGLMVFMAFLMRSCHLSLHALKDLMPNIVFLVAAILLTKFMLYDESWLLSVQIIALQCLSAALTLFVYKSYKKEDIKKIFTDRTVLLAGFFVGLCSLQFQTFKLTGMSTAQNPGYVEAVCLLAPLWIIFYNRMFKIEDKAKVLPGIGMVFAAILLSIFSTQV